MFGRNAVRSVLGKASVLLLAATALGPISARAADHRDGPRVINSAGTLGALDLNDLYLFPSPAHPNNTVMILTTGGAGVGILSPPFFLPGAVYELRVSNDGIATTDELIFQVAFSDPDSFLRQSYVVVSRDVRSGQAKVLTRGVTGKPALISGGGAVQAGLFDDPFFFDSIAFSKFRDAVQKGRPLAERVAPFLPPSIPNNFFANFNVLAIVIEVPRGWLQSSPSHPNISVWTRSLTPFGTQFDRTGLPAINTAVGFAQPLSGLPSIQDLFNSLTPADDPSLVPAAAERINLAYGLPIDQALSLAATVLPDVMPFNTTSRKGFLNGRRLEDDVIDAELGLLTGGALTSDRVINDSVFVNHFPYLSAPLPKPTKRAMNSIKQLQNSGN